MRFIGDYTAKTDAKGRVFVPAAFRRQLEGMEELALVLRKDVFQKCLVLYPMSVWNVQLDDLQRRLNPWSRKDQMMLRQFVADAEQVELDSQGRILLPKNKMQYADIVSEVRFLAMVDRIEIWSKDALDSLMAEAEGVIGDDIEARLNKMRVNETRSNEIDNDNEN